MSFNRLRSPLAFFEAVLGPYAPLDPGIFEYAAWWASEGDKLARNAAGQSDERLLACGYAAGMIRRVQVQESLLPSFTLLYITGFYDPWIAGLFSDCLVTHHIVDKYAPDNVRAVLLAQLAALENPSQGGVWLPPEGRFTARATADGWRLTGDGTPRHDMVDLTLFPAYPEGTDTEALFLVPKLRDDGSLNRVKSGQLHDSLAYLMATPAESAALRMEIQTLSQMFATIAWLGAAQRDLADPQASPEQIDALRVALALAWAAVQVGDDTAREVAGLYSDTYRRFRLLALLAEVQTFTLAGAVTTVKDGPTLERVERRLAQFPAALFELAPPLLAELAEFSDAAAPTASTDAARAWAQVLAQAFARKFEAAARLCPQRLNDDS